MRTLFFLIFCSLCLSVVGTASVLPDKAPPIPEVAAPRAENSVPKADFKSFEEVKLENLPSFEGPYEPTWESIEQQYPGEPEWLREAKFGI